MHFLAVTSGKLSSIKTCVNDNHLMHGTFFSVWIFEELFLAFFATSVKIKEKCVGKKISKLKSKDYLNFVQKMIVE